MRPEAWLLLLVGAAAFADSNTYEFGGHTKLRFIGTTFPSDSVFRSLAGSESLDLEGDLRLDFSAATGRWTAHADYQLIGLYGDRVEYTRELPPEVDLLVPRLPDDARRLFDFTKGIVTAVGIEKENAVIGQAGMNALEILQQIFPG